MKQIFSIVLALACAQPLSAQQVFQAMNRELDSRLAGAKKPVLASYTPLRVQESAHPDHPETASCKYLRPAAGALSGAAFSSLVFLGPGIMHGGWQAAKKDLPFLALAGALGGGLGSFIHDKMRNKGYSSKDSLYSAGILSGLTAGFLVGVPVMRFVSVRAAIWSFPLFTMAGTMSGILGGYVSGQLKTHLH